MERWLATFTAQKGLDMEQWPKEFMKRFGEVPPRNKIPLIPFM
jgi:hypothetical protein